MPKRYPERWRTDGNYNFGINSRPVGVERRGEMLDVVLGREVFTYSNQNRVADVRFGSEGVSGHQALERDDANGDDTLCDPATYAILSFSATRTVTYDDPAQGVESFSYSLLDNDLTGQRDEVREPESGNSLSLRKPSGDEVQSSTGGAWTVEVETPERTEVSDYSYNLSQRVTAQDAISAALDEATDALGFERSLSRQSVATALDPAGGLASVALNGDGSFLDEQATLNRSLTTAEGTTSQTLGLGGVSAVHRHVLQAQDRALYPTLTGGAQDTERERTRRAEVPLLNPWLVDERLSFSSIEAVTPELLGWGEREWTDGAGRWRRGKQLAWGLEELRCGRRRDGWSAWARLSALARLRGTMRLGWTISSTTNEITSWVDVGFEVAADGWSEAVDVVAEIDAAGRSRVFAIDLIDLEQWQEAESGGEWVAIDAVPADVVLDWSAGQGEWDGFDQFGNLRYPGFHRRDPDREEWQERFEWFYDEQLVTYLSPNPRGNCGEVYAGQSAHVVATHYRDGVDLSQSGFSWEIGSAVFDSAELGLYPPDYDARVFSTSSTGRGHPDRKHFVIPEAQADLPRSVLLANEPESYLAYFENVAWDTPIPLTHVAAEGTYSKFEINAIFPVLNRASLAPET